MLSNFSDHGDMCEDTAREERPTEETTPPVERDTKGRFTQGNTAALVHGARSKQASALQAPLREELRRQVIADLGGQENALAVTRLRLVDRFVETSLLCDSYMVFLEEQGGPIGTRGRQRAAVSGYLAVLDRQMKLAVLLGLEKRAKKVGTVEELLS